MVSGGFVGRIRVWTAGYQWEGPPTRSKGAIHDVWRYGARPSEDNLVLVESPKGPSTQERQAAGLSLDRFYDPFADAPSLFQIVADLKGNLTLEAVRDFADQYGRIAEYNRFDHRPHESRFGTWTILVASLADAIDLWDGIRANDQARIERHFDPNRSQVWSGPLIWGSDYEIESRLQFNLVEKLNQKGVLAAAPDLLHAVIACQLLETDFVARVVPVPGPNGTFTVQTQITDLTHVLWTQFALAVAESKQYRRCSWCGTPFEVSPPRSGRRRGRKDRLFCKDTCRVKHYLQRRNQAVKMRAEGKHLRQIAKAVETDIPQLKKWLGES